MLDDELLELIEAKEQPHWVVFHEALRTVEAVRDPTREDIKAALDVWRAACATQSNQED